jgi:acetyl-CoA C-acetyltransferase
MKTLLCAPKRTAIGAFQGSLAGFNAPFLGSQVLRATLRESTLDPKLVEEVYMGCVLTAGVGQAPARQAALAAGVDNGVPCTTVAKVCGSGLKAIMLADSAIRAADAACVLAGGMESMSQSPYLVPKLREGLRMGNGEIVDSMIKDGLWDVYNNFHMGNATELCVREYKLTREEQDSYAKLSYERAIAAGKAGLFKGEIEPLVLQSRKETITIDTDEGPTRYRPEKAAQLKPAFEKEGTVTPFNASSLNDGAASVLACSEAFAKTHRLQPMARVVSHAQAAQAPEWFTTAPTPAIQRALEKAGLKISDIDLWEINEAFAAVAIVNMRLLKLDPERVNVNGGAIALGHPIGASGARILATLLHALRTRNKRYGCASLCIGGGEGVAMVVENLQL